MGWFTYDRKAELTRTIIPILILLYVAAVGGLACGRSTMHGLVHSSTTSGPPTSDMVDEAHDRFAKTSKHINKQDAIKHRITRRCLTSSKFISLLRKVYEIQDWNARTDRARRAMNESMFCSKFFLIQLALYGPIKVAPSATGFDQWR